MNPLDYLTASLSDTVLGAKQTYIIILPYFIPCKNTRFMLCHTAPARALSADTRRETLYWLPRAPSADSDVIRAYCLARSQPSMSVSWQCQD